MYYRSKFFNLQIWARFHVDDTSVKRAPIGLQKKIDQKQCKTKGPQGHYILPDQKAAKRKVCERFVLSKLTFWTFLGATQTLRFTGCEHTKIKSAFFSMFFVFCTSPYRPKDPGSNLTGVLFLFI